jgi:large subunit ribosomal protein L4
MAQVKLFSQAGQDLGHVQVADILFDVKPSEALIHQAVLAQTANARVNLAHVKDRSEVRGGGKKPWRQKGTGRARHGSTRSPIWVGGGVTHGPRNDRNFSVKINKKTKRAALAMALTDKLSSGAMIAVDTFELPEAKTQYAAKMRKALPGNDKSALVVLTIEEANMRRALQNLPKTQGIYAHSLNVRDVVKFNTIIASKQALEVIEKTFSA